MGWVVPQFKCLPDTCHLTTRLWPALPNHHSSSQKLKNRESLSVRPRCLVLSTAVVAVDTFVTHSSTLATERPLTYVGAIGPPTKTDFEMKQAPKGLLPSEDSNIAVAAAEAVALARAAAEMAKDAMQMMGSSLPIKAVDSDGFPSEIDILLLERMRLTEMETPDDLEPSCIPENIPEEKRITANSFTEQQSTVSVDSEFELVRAQHSNNIAVKSGRQTERRARRSRAAEKVDASIVSTKPGSSSRKKRAALQEVDYSDPLRYLRGTTSTSKLLTAAEELELSEGIQDLLKLEKLHEELTERYGNKPTFVQWASAAGTDQKTLRRRLNCGTLCKDKMIKSNIRLVISIAKNFQGAGMNLQDLVQEGCRGLVRGAEKFDASKGFKFSTYAHWWIKQAVRKSLSDQSRTIRLPFHMVDATYRVREARKQFYSENGQYPNNEEIVEVTGLSMKRLQAVLLTPKAPRSLDQKIGINQNLKPSEVIADPNAETAESLLLKHFMKQDLNKVLDTLNPREKQVVRWRFGLEDGRMKTLQEIGELMGVSRERIRQIESCAFRKLKNKKKTKSLRQYLIS